MPFGVTEIRFSWPACALAAAVIAAALAWFLPSGWRRISRGAAAVASSAGSVVVVALAWVVVVLLRAAGLISR